MEIINRQTLYNGFYKLYKFTIAHEGKTFDREVFKTGIALAGLVYHTSQKKFVFVKQYRAGVEQEVTEMVAGLHEEEDQNLEDGLKREIEEETGYVVDYLEPICKVYPSPGAMAEISHLYYAEVSRRKSEGGGNDEENENIEVIELTPEESDQREWRDAKTLIALQWFKLNKRN
jgi:ADP-ribose pyrophosphatase